MPKVTYPRLHRYQCSHCPLSFTQKGNLRRHVQQQHSKTPQRFTCPECGNEFTAKQGMKQHLETVCAEVKPAYICVFCSARFTWERSRRYHMQKVHGFGCDEEDINLLLHLQQLSEEPGCKDEWMFVESRPIDVGEHNICPCGQTGIENYFFLENKINGNRTFVGSTCIENIDSLAGQVIGYFQYILTQAIEGAFVENVSEGFQTFIVKPHTVLVKGADSYIKHLNPQVMKNLAGKWEVLVKYSKPETLIPGQAYGLRLKAKYVRGQLTFTAV